MRKYRCVRALGVVLGCIVVFTAWFIVASNYDHDALARTDEFSGNGEKRTPTVASGQRKTSFHGWG